MTSPVVAPRLLPETVREYLAAGKPSRHSVGTDVNITIDPASSSVSLRVPATGPLPDVTAFSRVAVRESLGEYVIAIEARESEYEAYCVLHAAASLIESGTPAGDAVPAALEAFRELLSKRSRLSDEQETGLFGELIVLGLLLDVLPVAEALESWLGPTAQPHDFGLRDVDLEVKTTRSNRHVHTISSLQQLLPAGDRPLVVAAIRIEASGSASDGRSLAELVAVTRARVVGSAATFDTLLGGTGWTLEATDLHTRRFRLVDLLFFSIDQGFPALTRDAVAAVVPNAALLLDASYRLDLTDHPSTVAPVPLDSAPSTSENPR
jgi:hypothetical protein